MKVDLVQRVFERKVWRRWKKSSKKSLPILGELVAVYLGDNDYLIDRYSILDERMVVIKHWAYFEGVTTDE